MYDYKSCGDARGRLAEVSYLLGDQDEEVFTDDQIKELQKEAREIRNFLYENDEAP